MQTEAMLENIRNKIRKLLRLAKDKGASEAEAANAMAMASRLMLQHNISEIGEEEDHDKVIIGEWMNLSRADDWEKVVGIAVANLFACRHITDKQGRGFHKWAGRAANIEACQETYVWVCEQVETLYKEHLKSYGGALNKSLRAELRQTFKEACAFRIFRRVGEIIMQNRGDIPSHLALVVIDQSLAKTDEMLKDLPSSKELKLRKTGIGSGAGFSAAEQIQLQGQVKNG